MPELVTYQRSDRVSTITMDDGKVNVFSLAMLGALHEAFDRAERDGTVVLLRGRPGYFSAGFDLKVINGASEDVALMLRLGATLAGRILSFPAPVVAACTGHAFPAGAFLLMAADTRLGADGPFKLGLNEVRIGLTLPWFAIVLARHRLTPAHFDHAAVTGTMFDPAVPGRRVCSTRWSGPTSWTLRRSPPPRSSARWTAARTRPPSCGHASGSSASCARPSTASSGERRPLPAHTGHPAPSGP